MIKYRKFKELKNILKIGDYILISGATYPFKVIKIEENRFYVSELRPFWIYTEGYLQDDTEIKILTAKKEIEQAKHLEENKEKWIYPRI